MYKKPLRCSECAQEIEREYMEISGEILCMECAEDFMADELEEMRQHSPSEYRERVADMLGLKIWEVLC